MEQSVKLRLGLALLLTQIVLYYYFPKGGSSERPNHETVSDVLCQVSSARNVCFSPISALLDLCPLPKVYFTPRQTESKDDNSGDDDEEISENVGDRRKHFQKEGQEKEDDENEEAEMPAFEEKRIHGKEEKESSLIYHIIVVLLVVSVTASLADCFHERSRRKANPELAVSTSSLRGEPTLNRRMSLADLTMQRHVRRESQASFRPPGSRPVLEGFTGRRSSSQESPRTTIRQAPCKQRSCPAPFLKRLSVVDLQDLRDAQDGAWAEKRRVRMIQRH